MKVPAAALAALLLALAPLAACGSSDSDMVPVVEPHPEVASAPASAPCPYAAAHDGTQSYDILCRDPVANQVEVLHILLGWKGLVRGDGILDPRAQKRTYAQAQALARELLAKLRAGAKIEPLMTQYSEDLGSAATAQPYVVTPGAQLVSEFKSLALRLHVGEAGIVKSQFGLHVMLRIK